MDGKRDFIKGAVILSISGILVKLLGAALRIPIANKLGEGMAYYNVAYTIYAIFLVLATAGIPVAVSRMVSERTAVGNEAGARKVFVTALKLMAVIGAAAFAICFFGADLIAFVIDIPGSQNSLRSIAPALCIVPLLAAFRGYFQGQQDMRPTAVSEVCEQVVRVAAGLGLGFYLYDEGLDIAAAGATFGAVAGAAAGMSVMGLIYWRRRRQCRKTAERLGDDVCNASARTESSVEILKKIAWIAVPIVIGAEIMPLMSAIDTTLVVSRLKDTGWEAGAALNLYNQYGAYCDTLISLPQTFTQAIAVSLVPSIAAFYWQGRKGKVQENIQISMRMTMLLACPCAVGLFVLAEPILLLLYFNQRENALQAVPTLQVMTIGVILLAVVQTTTGALQSVGRQMKPVRNMAVGAVLKAVLTYVLVGIPAIHVKGAALGTSGAYLAALILNLYEVKKETGVHFPFLQTYVKPMAASVIMGLCAYGSYNVISAWAGNAAGVFGSILLSIGAYCVLVLRMKAVSPAELSALPGGEFLMRIFRV